jgi:hypothetical protein
MLSMIVLVIAHGCMYFYSSSSNPVISSRGLFGTVEGDCEKVIWYFSFEGYSRGNDVGILSAGFQP